MTFRSRFDHFLVDSVRLATFRSDLDHLVFSVTVRSRLQLRGKSRCALYRIPLVTAYPQVVYEAVYMDMDWKLQNNCEKRASLQRRLFIEICKI